MGQNSLNRYVNIQRGVIALVDVVLRKSARRRAEAFPVDRNRIIRLASNQLPRQDSERVGI
jgi:hypothetical protein